MIESLPIALGFQQPWMLLGIVLGAIPIVIHLWRRRQHQQTDWAAMRFLLAAARKHSRRIRFEQLLLLMLRAAIPILLALALADPYRDLPPGDGRPADPVRRILVIDASLSMQARTGADANRIRFRDAIARARSIVERAAKGDGFQIIVLRTSGIQIPLREISRKPREVLAILDELAPTDEGCDLIAAVGKINELLGIGSFSRNEVHMISDFQRSHWAEGNNQGKIRSSLRDLSHRADVVFSRIGQRKPDNIAVVGLRLGDEIPLFGREITLRADVRNDDAGPALRLPVELFLDGRKIDEQHVDLPSRSVESVRFRLRVPNPGRSTDRKEYTIEVRVRDDDLARDGVRRAVLEARRKLPILLVNGRPAIRDSDTATHYLSAALDPSSGRASSRPATEFSVRVVGDRDLSPERVRASAAVVLCNVPKLPPKELKLLDNYVRSGGALVIVLGDRVDRGHYNRELFSGGKRLMPAKLIEPIGRAKSTESDAFFLPDADRSAMMHPVMSRFAGNPGSLSSLFTLGYIRAELPGATNAQSVIRLGNGDPLVIEKPYGAGRVVLVTTAFERNWSVWPLSRVFPVMAQSIVRFAVTAKGDRKALLAGGLHSRSFVSPGMAASALVMKPDGTSAKVDLSARGVTLVSRFNETSLAGFYRVELGKPLAAKYTFAVNTPAQESRLAALSTRELELLLPVAQSFSEWESAERGTASASTAALAPWLLIAVVAVLVIEQVMAWRFRLGFLLLLAIAALAMLAPLVRAEWWMILAAIFVGGAVWMAMRDRHSAEPI